MTDVKTQIVKSVEVTTTTELETLRKANAFLKNRVLELENDLKTLSDLFSEKLLSETGIEYETIKWCIEVGKLTGIFNDNKLIIDLTEKTVDIQKVIHQNLYCRKSSDTVTCENKPTIELMPPLDYSAEADNVDEKPAFDMKQLYHENVKSLIDEHIVAARNYGEDMYINSDGSVAYPSNFSRNIQGYICPKTITLDDYDVLVDCVLEDYKNIDILEDDNTMVFHFGGDSND